MMVFRLRTFRSAPVQHYLYSNPVSAIQLLCEQSDEIAHKLSCNTLFNKITNNRYCTSISHILLREHVIGIKQKQRLTSMPFLVARQKQGC